MKRLRAAEMRPRVLALLAIDPNRTDRSIADELDLSTSFVGDARRNGGVPTCDEQRLALIERLLSEGKGTYAIVHAAKTSPARVNELRRARAARGLIDPTPAEIQKQTMRTMAADGCSSSQIAAVLGIQEQRVRVLCARVGIVVLGDQLTAGRKRVDGNRVMRSIVTDADLLTADLNLVDFPTLAREELGGWLKALREARRKLSQLIGRLQLLQDGGGDDVEEDANSATTPIEDSSGVDKPDAGASRVSHPAAVPKGVGR